MAVIDIPIMTDITPTEAKFVADYHAALQRGDKTAADYALSQIINPETKMVTASLINKITTACRELDKEYQQKFSPAYIVSETQPAVQNIGDYWLEVTGTV